MYKLTDPQTNEILDNDGEPVTIKIELTHVDSKSRRANINVELVDSKGCTLAVLFENSLALGDSLSFSPTDLKLSDFFTVNHG